ncbi:MAG: hypothetical protein Q9215_006628, partial [Flavoplaca cf. flavocitrina]
MDAMFGGAIGGKNKSRSLKVHPTSSTTMLEWPRREACANLPDQIKLTAEHGQNLLLTIAEAPKCGLKVQMNEDSIVNFVKNVIRMCEMIAKPDPAELQDQSEGHDEPARHHEPAGVVSSDQENVVRALDEIKKLKMEMDAKVAAVEAAIRTQNQSTALTLANRPDHDTGRISETLQTTTRNLASVPTFGEIGQLERTRTCREASVDFRSDTPIFGSFRSTSQSALKPNSEVQGRAGFNATAAESTMQPRTGAVTTSGAAHVAAGTSPGASNPQAIVDSTTRTNDHMDSTIPGLAAAPTSGVPCTTHPVALQTSVPEDRVQTSDTVVEKSAQPSVHSMLDQPMSGCDVNESCLSVDKTATASADSGEASETTEQPGYVSSNRSSTSKTPYSYDQAVSESASDSDSSSSTEQSAASSPSNEEASKSTERVRNDATNRSNSDQTAMQSTVRPSDSATFIAPAETDNGSDDEDNNDESGEEESDNDGTSEGDSDDNSSDDEDTQMEDTETSEQSEDSNVPDPKPIEVWRTPIAKPESTGTPKSVRAVSPSQTIPAAPIRKRNKY